MTPKERKKYEADGFHVFDEPRIYASILKLSEWSGHDRATVAKRLNSAGIQHRDGPRRAKLYPTDLALWAIATG